MSALVHTHVERAEGGREGGREGREGGTVEGAEGGREGGKKDHSILCSQGCTYTMCERDCVHESIARKQEFSRNQDTHKEQEQGNVFSQKRAENKIHLINTTGSRSQHALWKSGQAFIKLCLQTTNSAMSHEGRKLRSDQFCQTGQPGKRGLKNRWP